MNSGPLSVVKREVLKAILGEIKDEKAETYLLSPMSLSYI